MTDQINHEVERQRFTTIVNVLLDTYRPAGVCIWLSSPNKHLSGHRPSDVMAGNSHHTWDDLADAVQRIDGGNW